MKFLKTILVSVYVILIILLILTNLNRCGSKRIEENIQEQELPTKQRDSQPVDTAKIIKQAEKTGKSGNLKVTLMWNFPGDIDLHAKQPNGKEIFYDKNVDRTTGGFLDVDNKEGGSGAAENIYWENPPKGRYDISLVYYQPAEKSKIAGAGTCMVVVFKQGQSPQTFEVEMSNVKEQKHVTYIEIN